MTIFPDNSASPVRYSSLGSSREKSSDMEGLWPPYDNDDHGHDDDDHDDHDDDDHDDDDNNYHKLITE